MAIQQTPRCDLPLRAENQYALSLAGFDTHHPELLCLDELPTTTGSGPAVPSQRFALVDHNRLHAKFTRDNPGAQVVAIVDHHEDEGFHLDADPRIVRVPTGSCTSLVAQFLQEHCADRVPKELATLLLCGILIDTNGLKKGGKAVEADRIAAAFLQERALFPAVTASAASEESASGMDTLLKTLQEKKFDISHLSTRDQIRRDYKEYTMTPSWAATQPILIGIASVPLGLKYWVPNDSDFAGSVEKWMDDRGLAALGICTSFHDKDKKHDGKHGKHKREQLWVVRTAEGADAEAGVGVEGLAERLFKSLEESEVLKLKEKDLKEDYGIKKKAGFRGDFVARVWGQKNVDATRKVTAPLVRETVEGKGEDQAS